MENFKIENYLQDFDKTTRRGQCKGCLKMVNWSKEALSSHKRATCEAGNAEEKRRFS
jgi:hypothetical protein